VGCIRNRDGRGSDGARCWQLGRRGRACPHSSWGQPWHDHDSIAGQPIQPQSRDGYQHIAGSPDAAVSVSGSDESNTQGRDVILTAVRRTHSSRRHAHAGVHRATPAAYAAVTDPHANANIDPRANAASCALAVHGLYQPSTNVHGPLRHQQRDRVHHLVPGQQQHLVYRPLPGQQQPNLLELLRRLEQPPLQRAQLLEEVTGAQRATRCTPA
jgi:hypothetical protein